MRIGNNIENKLEIEEWKEAIDKRENDVIK